MTGLIYNGKKVTSVYKGENGECTCGCSGQYYYPEENSRQEYEAAKILHQLYTWHNEVEELTEGKTYSLEMGETLYIVNTEAAAS